MEKTENLLQVSSNPHTRDTGTTAEIMRTVLISLCPAAIFGVWNFGFHALLLIVVTVATCVLAEFLYEKALHLPITVTDFSAAVTGLLLALNLPPTLPVWMAVLGGVFAIIIVKMLFGGLGQNFMNPALGARCFLLISFSQAMTTFTKVDAVTGATPLAVLKSGGSVNLLDMFIGNTAGTIGETSAAALLLGAAYLLICHVIDFRIPLTYIGTFTVFVAMVQLFSGNGFSVTYLLAEICGGGLLLGAFFMATDYVTSPITPGGKIIYGVLLGVLTGIFRMYGSSAEGVSYAIIFSNLLVPLIERISIPRAFGRERRAS
ncbi:MAG: RnfABCDGE type electron transport complex subunit D [Lachnospiraceae bacterium]|nr:RnfABCDGE type electron transport complex subunit D [Lachnospiraceae bacterium]